MKQKNKNGITLEKLAAMVARGFEFIERRMATKDDINRLDYRMDVLERKVDKIDLHIEEINENLDNKESDFLDLQRKVKILERGVKTAGSKV